MRLFAFLLFSLVLIPSQAQILHTESFAVIIDTTKFIKGSILPDVKFQNLKENLIELENQSDITFRFKKQAFTFANKVELSKFGKQTFLSGGFVYLEYRRIMESKWVLEPYAQVQWAEARGLALKYATGMNLRYRILANESMGIFAGSGPFYEYEDWNYRGVKDELLPLD